uniref:Uncharacterized protein n=1 Tax=Zea mays TaxID=4577 RepID=A0A804RGU5_MAIZE
MWAQSTLFFTTAQCTSLFHPKYAQRDSKKKKKNILLASIRRVAASRASGLHRHGFLGAHHHVALQEDAQPTARRQDEDAAPPPPPPISFSFFVSHGAERRDGQVAALRRGDGVHVRGRAGHVDHARQGQDLRRRRRLVTARHR